MASASSRMHLISQLSPPAWSRQRTAQNYISESASDGNTDMSIELGRGLKKTSARGPAKDNTPTFSLNMGNGTYYELTETPPLMRGHGRKNGTLRRQASFRNAETTRADAPASYPPNKIVMGHVISDKIAPANRPFTLGDALKQLEMDNNAALVAEDTARLQAAYNPRNTRFTRSKQPTMAEPNRATGAMPASAQSSTRPVGGNNATSQSASLTLPNLPNLNELVTGAHKDVTPLSGRNVKTSSRFTTATSKTQIHHSVASVEVPYEEKAIYASLQLLKERSEQLESALAEAQKRNEEFENEIVQLRSQVSALERRPDSALGSDDGEELTKKENTKLHAAIKAMQHRIDRCERKASVSDIATKRVTQERNKLLDDMGALQSVNDELKAGIKLYKDSYEVLQTEHWELQDEVDALRKENEELRLLMAQTDKSYEHDALQRQKLEFECKKKSIVFSNALPPSGTFSEKSNDNIPMMPGAYPSKSRKETKEGTTGEHNQYEAADDTQEMIRKQVAKAVKKLREVAAVEAAAQDKRPIPHEHIIKGRVRSKSVPQEHTHTGTFKMQVPDRPSSAPLESNASDAESTTELDFSQPVRTSPNPSEKVYVPRTRPRAPIVPRDEDNRDLTLLSWQDADEVSNLRRKLEEDRRTSNRSGDSTSKERPSTPPPPNTFAIHRSVTEAFNASLHNGIHADPSAQQAMHIPNPIPTLKSSMKDIYNRVGEGSAPSSIVPNLSKVMKTSDASDANNRRRSMNSDGFENSSFVVPSVTFSGASSFTSASRRRRSMASDGFETSSFIVPDVTLSDVSSDWDGHVDAASTKVLNAQFHDTQTCEVCVAEANGQPHPGRDFDGHAAALQAAGCNSFVLKPSTAYSDSVIHRPIQSTEASREPSAVSKKSDQSINTSASSTDGGVRFSGHSTDNPAQAIKEPEVIIPAPIPVSEREDHRDITDATIRPAQEPSIALADVIKQLKDEIKSLKIQLAVQQRLYNKHDPAISKRKRMATKELMDKLTAEIEKRSDQVYSLYDVLEGQKQWVNGTGVEDEMDMEATLESLGIDASGF